MVCVDSHPPSPPSSSSICIPTTKIEARSAWSLLYSVQPAEGLQLSTESAEHLLAKTFVLAAKRARLVSMACLRGLQLGAVSCPGPSLAPLEPLGFWKRVRALL